MNTISSRTPEGQDNQCPICRRTCTIEPSAGSHEAPCPYCGHLLWFTSYGLVGVAASNIVRSSDPAITVGTLPDDLRIAPQILELCTQQLAIENCILPIDCSDDAVLIAMHDPSNTDKVDKIRFVLNRDVRILHVDQESLRYHVAACYGTDN